MKNIHSFIIHVVNNLFPLNEYSEGEIKKLIDKFKEEADDLNIEISDEKLKLYIQRFDQLKNSPKIQEKDLRKYSLSQLIKLVTSTKGVEEPPEAADATPDVVYNENGLIIYNGSKEDNCLNFGRGERWCITKGSFGSYRYDDNRKNPTFYLVKDTNLPDSDRKSFFVVVVGNDDTYKASDRSNNDVGGRGTEWNRWEPWSFVESNFPSVAGLRNIFKYIPLSTKEKINQQYGSKPISIREWTKLPFSVKEQYLIVRKGKELFNDISNDIFIEKYLPKYPQIANTIATNYGIINSLTLVRNLDKFSNQDVKSIIANMRDKIKSKFLSSESIPFSVKKLLVNLNKWEINSEERLYVTKDGETIVKLTFGDDLKMSIYTAEDDYPNVKLNTRTSKYLTEYPELDKLPFKNLLKLASDGVLSKEFINTILTKAQEDPNSAIIVKDTDAGKIILDSNSFTSFKLENGRISSIPFDSEEVQNILNGEAENTSFQTNAVNLLFSDQDIPDRIDKDAFYNIINNTPSNNRIRNERIAILDSVSDQIIIFPTNPENITSTSTSGFNINSDSQWGKYYNILGYNTFFSVEIWRKYFDYLRSRNISFNDVSIRAVMNAIPRRCNENFLKANPPMSDTSELRPVNVNDKLYLVNIRNPQNSFRLSSATGRLLQMNANSSLVARATGRQQAATPAAPTGRRGRPAGVPAAVGAGERVAAPLAPAAANADITNILDFNGLTDGFNTLPANIRTRILAGNTIPYTRRNAAIDAIGRVRHVVSAGPSRFYIIRMPSGRIIGFATMQPDARHYIVTGNTSYRVPRVGQLAASLQQNNINESLKTLIKFHAAAMPEEAQQMKEILLKLKNK